MRTFPLLICRDTLTSNVEATAPWMAELGNRKYAQLSFASEAERVQVAMEALIFGYRVQFATIEEFERDSGVADVKALCSTYYDDSGADNPTCQMEYETAVAGGIISALQTMYQFEAYP